VPASPEVAKPVLCTAGLYLSKAVSISSANHGGACGADFTIALTDNGDVCSLGEGEDGQLGPGTNKPAWVDGRDVFKEPVVLVAAGWTHAACVTSKGVLYTWGNGKHGELGDGFQEIRLNPQQINLATHGGEPAVMVSCGASHTVVLTEAG